MGVQTRDEVLRVLRQIQFAPSCLDMGWDWEVEPVLSARAVVSVLNCDPSEGAKLMGWNIRTTFQRPDTDTGEIGTGFGRWWFVEENTSVSGLVKTAWLACKQIVEHELMEAFMFQGVRVFDPHAEVHDLMDLNRRSRL